MPTQYSTTLIVLTVVLSVLIGVGLLFLVFSEATVVSCEDLGLAVTCTTDTQCGPTGFFGEPYCEDGNIWQQYYQSVCAGIPGTCDSYCDSGQAAREVQQCKNGCANGQCLD